MAWFFLVDRLFIPAVTFRVWRGLWRDQIAPVLRWGVFGVLVAFASFGAIMEATRLDQVGKVAVLRETSTVFAALIGRLILRERRDPVQVSLMAMIAMGAVMMEWAG